MRITRIAESFWHSEININETQKGLFPVVAFEGVSHAQFMSGVPPSTVAKRDLKPDVSEEIAHQWTANSIVDFIDQIVFDNPTSLNTNTSQVLQPLIDAMVLEGNYQLKPPCYNIDLINPESLTCLHGSPWNDLYS